MKKVRFYKQKSRLGSSEKIFIPKSELRVEYIDKMDNLSKYADSIDLIFTKLYGNEYPYKMKNEIVKFGPDSRIIGIWFGNVLIGYSGFVHDKVHNRVEFGRLVKHPDYNFNIMVMDQYLNHIIEELHRDGDKILFGTTRLWITSAYLELLQFKMCGSMILPLHISSTWDNTTCYPYFGVYNLPLRHRIANTHQIPKWVRNLFIHWDDLFSSFNWGLPETAIEQDIIEMEFLPEISNDEMKMKGGKMFYVPCINSLKIKEKVHSLLKEGYVLSAFYPSWYKINLTNNLASKSTNNTTSKSTNNTTSNSSNNTIDNASDNIRDNMTNNTSSYVSILLLVKVSHAIHNFPKNFALSAIHYDFAREHFCNHQGMDLLYNKPFNQLFRRRKMGLLRRTSIKFFDRFYQVKVHSLFDEHSVNNSVAQIFK
ncbi:hypothetical protein [Candidatus Harpocratesius sp.]